MALIHKENSYCAKSELDLFALLPTQLCIDKNVTVKYMSTTPLAGNGPLEFQVDGSDDFTDLCQYVKHTYN